MQPKGVWNLLKRFLVRPKRPIAGAAAVESSGGSICQDRVCMCIDLVLSSSIDDTVSFYGDSDVLAPSLFPVAPVTFGDAPPPDVSDIAVIVGTTARARLSRERVPHAFTLPRG